MHVLPAYITSRKWWRYCKIRGVKKGAPPIWRGLHHRQCCLHGSPCHCLQESILQLRSSSSWLLVPCSKLSLGCKFRSGLCWRSFSIMSKFLAVSNSNEQVLDVGCDTRKRAASYVKRKLSRERRSAVKDLFSRWSVALNGKHWISPVHWNPSTLLGDKQVRSSSIKRILREAAWSSYQPYLAGMV